MALHCSPLVDSICHSCPSVKAQDREEWSIWSTTGQAGQSKVAEVWVHRHLHVLIRAWIQPWPEVDLHNWTSRWWPQRNRSHQFASRSRSYGISGLEELDPIRFTVRTRFRRTSTSQVSILSILDHLSLSTQVYALHQGNDSLIIHSFNQSWIHSHFHTLTKITLKYNGNSIFSI